MFIELGPTRLNGAAATVAVEVIERSPAMPLYIGLQTDYKCTGELMVPPSCPPPMKPPVFAIKFPVAPAAIAAKIELLAGSTGSGASADVVMPALLFWLQV